MYQIIRQLKNILNSDMKTLSCYVFTTEYLHGDDMPQFCAVLNERPEAVHVFQIKAEYCITRPRYNLNMTYTSTSSTPIVHYRSLGHQNITLRVTCNHASYNYTNVIIQSVKV